MRHSYVIIVLIYILVFLCSCNDTRIIVQETEDPQRPQFFFTHAIKRSNPVRVKSLVINELYGSGVSDVMWEICPAQQGVNPSLSWVQYGRVPEEFSEKEIAKVLSPGKIYSIELFYGDAKVSTKFVINRDDGKVIQITD